MTTLARFLFPLPATRRSSATLMAWWERRRAAYNAIVGGTGIVTLLALRALEALPPHMSFVVPWQAIIIYGLCANLCFTLGFVLEALCERLWGGEVAPVGPTLFRHGIAFSVGLTAFPAVIATGVWMVAVVRRLFHF